MTLIDTDDATLLDRMERSPELVLPEVRRLQDVRAAAERWATAGLCGNQPSDVTERFLDLLTALRADGMQA